MNFELKNGLLYNIATMYYHLGNPEEARNSGHVQSRQLGLYIEYESPFQT